MQLTKKKLFSVHYLCITFFVKITKFLFIFSTNALCKSLENLFQKWGIVRVRTTKKNVDLEQLRDLNLFTVYVPKVRKTLQPDKNITASSKCLMLEDFIIPLQAK